MSYQYFTRTSPSLSGPSSQSSPNHRRSAIMLSSDSLELRASSVSFSTKKRWCSCGLTSAWTVSWSRRQHSDLQLSSFSCYVLALHTLPVGKKQTTVHPPIRDSINSSTIGVIDILLEQRFVKLHDIMFPRYQTVARSTESSLLTLNIYRASQKKHWHKSSYDSATVVV